MPSVVNTKGSKKIGPVSIPVKKKEISDTAKKTDRRTAASTISNKVSIGDDFWKLKNPKRREAVLQHEIGHVNLHNATASDKELKSEAIWKKVKDADKRETEKIRKDDSEFINKALKDHPIAKKIAKTAYDTVNKVSDIKDKGTDKFLDKKYKDGGVSNNDRTKLRESSLSKYEKIDKKNNALHANATEFEADRYAANKVGESQLKRALRESYKKSRKNDGTIKQQQKELQEKLNLLSNKNVSRKDTEKSVKQAISDLNRSRDSDYKARVKALKDKSLTDKEKQNYR